MDGYQYSGLIIGGIVVILIVRIIIGYWASKKVQTTNDYVLAGRRLPIWMAAPSIMATWFAAETLMGSSSEAYKYGLQGVIFDPFGATMCLVLSAFLVVRLARRAQYVTIMDFFQHRYGTAMSVMGSVAQIISYFGWTAAQIVAGGAILQALLGWPLQAGMVLVATIVTLYTLMGGLWADTALDFMQMFLTCIGLLIIFGGILWAVGGLDAFLNMAGAQYTDYPFAMAPTAEEGYFGYQGTLGWFYYAAAWMAIGLGSIPAQDYLQRTCAAKNEKVAVKSTYIAAFLYITFGVLSPFIGMAAYSALGPEIEADSTQFVLISMAMKYLPPVLTAAFVAALASALMSTSDSSMLAGATMFTENIVKQFKPDLSDKSQLLLTRLSLLVSGILSLYIAMVAETIYELAVLANTCILVGMVAPYIIGMYWRRANHIGAISSFLTGTLSWIALTFFYYRQTFPFCEGDVECATWDAVYIASTPAFIISIVVFLVVSVLTNRIDPPKPLTDINGQLVDMRNPLGWGDLSETPKRVMPPVAADD
ncbi:MAG TPA: sodium:solute symporter family protein [Anaerolineales bacterium]|nr:sodium:solute symporter family protein [Anaerolineales bacterium]